MVNPHINHIERINFLRVPMDIIPEDKISPVLLELTQMTGHRSIVFLTYKGLMKARRDSEFLGFLQRAALVIPVSKSLERGCRFLGLPQPFRYHPFDFIIRMLGVLEQKNFSYYLFGDRIQAIQRIASNMRTSFPKLNLVGRHVGFFPKDTEGTILTAIQKATPKVLLLGPGVPGKEKWAFQHAQELPVSLSVYSAEMFQIASGAKTRPSKELFRSSGHEMGEALRNPLRWYRCFSFLWYGLLLFVYKLKK